MLEIYLLTSLAPIPVATLSNRELGSTGQNYIKSLFAVGFQGLLILVCVAIYAVLIQGMASLMPAYIPEAVQAPTMGNLNGRDRSPTMAAAIPEMYYLCLRCPAASIPHRSPWSFVSI